MSDEQSTERADVFVGLIGTSLDAVTDGGSLARDANYSRFYFQRLFREATGETPSDLRRRLRLERAAYRLRHTRQPVTEIAFEAGYESLEGFSRTFRKAYGISPSHYRRVEPFGWYLAAPNDIHYDPAAHGPIRLARQKGGTMDLTERMTQNDAWWTKRLLDKAGSLKDTQLDAPLPAPQSPLPFEGPERTLRALLNRIVSTKEMWMAAVHRRALPAQADESVAGLLRRCDAAYGEFAAVVRGVRDENRWDELFVDAVCEPPETFTYGGMIAHVLTFSSHRIVAAIRAMQQMGVSDLGYGDPIEWERTMMEG